MKTTEIRRLIDPARNGDKDALLAAVELAERLLLETRARPLPAGIRTRAAQALLMPAMPKDYAGASCYRRLSHWRYDRRGRQRTALGDRPHTAPKLTVATGRNRPLAALTKGGLSAVTRALAIEYAKQGIRVNAVTPGVTKTPMHSEEYYEILGALHPLGRMGEASEVASAIVFLDSAAFITGEILHVDGGQSAGQ